MAAAGYTYSTGVGPTDPNQQQGSGAPPPAQPYAPSPAPVVTPPTGSPGDPTTVSAPASQQALQQNYVNADGMKFNSSYFQGGTGSGGLNNSYTGDNLLSHFNTDQLNHLNQSAGFDHAIGSTYTGQGGATLNYGQGPNGLGETFNSGGQSYDPSQYANVLAAFNQHIDAYNALPVAKQYGYGPGNSNPAYVGHIADATTLGGMYQTLGQYQWLKTPNQGGDPYFGALYQDQSYTNPAPVDPRTSAIYAGQNSPGGLGTTGSSAGAGLRG